MQQLFELYKSKLHSVDTNFVRYLYDRINWKSQLIVIVGSRGVGKTTLMLQHIRRSNAETKSLYVAADNAYFSAHSLFDVAKFVAQQGGETLYIDEVHKYANWSTEIKMIYDYLPTLRVVVSGSSILDIVSGAEADLSRRAITYTLEGLSFREYLNFSLHLNIKPFTLQEIVSGKVELPSKVAHPLAHFKEYLRRGFFPFFAQDDYYNRLENVINQTMEIDVPAFAKMNVATVRKLKKLLYVISTSVPFKPNFAELGRAIQADRGTVADYMVYMEKSKLTQQLMSADGGMAMVEKVEKVYLGNTCFIYALSGQRADIGNVRETFFLNAMAVNHKVTASKVSDFVVDGLTFEVGGKQKSKRQIKDVENAYVVKDDVENAFLNIIPLWHFGLNY